MNPTELELRDIHLPDPIGWWPPAPGWWIVLLLLILLAVAAVMFWRHFRRPRIKQLALAELQSIQASGQTDQQQLQALSAWLRRVAMSLSGRQGVAALTGEAWLKYLDQGVSDDSFSHGTGRQLVEASYRPQAEIELQSVYALCRRWLDAQAEKPSGVEQ